MRVLAYVYPGWHSIPERDEAFYPGFTEWDLVYGSAPRFAGHVQPRLPLWGRYDDRDPVAVERRVALCRDHGIDGLVYGFFWCRGKRVFQDALDLGYLGSTAGQRTPFALMWANRMPRRVLPVQRADLPVIEAERLVPSDVDDFVALIGYLAERYFVRDNYLRVDGRVYFSIFDSTFFVRELGRDAARLAIARARELLAARGLPPLHLAAIEPNPDVIGQVRELGFDSVTNYVLLPDWKGDFLQDYDERVALRAAEWPQLAARAGLPYHPSVTPGWDASPRGADFGPARPNKYPWWPVVTGEHPERFRAAVARAVAYARASGLADDAQLVFVASLNEWSEGHYLEPDTRFGLGWIEAVRDGRGVKAWSTALPGVMLIELDAYHDDRGTLVETFHRDHHAALGIAADLTFVQDNWTSSRAGVVRGLHYQLTRPQGKLLHVVAGAIFDVVVDVRRGSPTFGRWFGVDLAAGDRRQLWIPPGLAHGFQARSATADVVYKLTAPYQPADERAVRWDDPDLAIAWPHPDVAIVSDRDRRAPALRDAELPRYAP